MGEQNQQVDEHELKAALIQKLKPLYAPVEGPLLYRAYRKVYDNLFDQHHAHINTENYTHRDADSFSESQQVSRTIASLKKIKEFNHHYFNDQELRVLNPAPTGILPEVMRLGFAGFNALYLTMLWRSCSFNKRTIGVLGGLIVGQYVALQVPNFFNECLQFPRRRALAKKYISQYGYNYFHDILDPRYDLHKLHDLQNVIHY